MLHLGLLAGVVAGNAAAHAAAIDALWHRSWASEFDTLCDWDGAPEGGVAAGGP